MANMFSGSGKLETLNLPETWGGENLTDLAYMFNSSCDMENLDLSGLQTSAEGASMQNMFSNANIRKIILPENMKATNLECTWLSDSWNSTLKEVENIETMDVTAVQSFNKMFYGCRTLGTEGSVIPNLSQWETNSATDMSYMFYQCNKITNLDLSGLKLDNSRNTDFMFEGCTSLETVIGAANWNVANVQTMTAMFNSCENLRLDCSGWNPTISKPDRFANSAPGVTLPAAWTTTE